MTDRIEPALSASEWASLADVDPDIMSGEPLTGIGIGYTNGDFRTGSLHNPFSPTQMIALANAALPDDDSRKITREWVRALRALATALETAHGTKMIGAVRVVGPAGTASISLGDDFGAMADALASYLPPE